MKSFGLVTGVSGVGKSTRVNQLIKFLETKYDSRIFDNGKITGKLFEELDLLIIGKYIKNKTNNIVWTSMDSLWGKFSSSEKTVNSIKELEQNILLEGSVNMDTFRIRPDHLSESGCLKYFYQIYTYNGDFDSYLERIRIRSGFYPKGKTSFEKSKALEHLEVNVNEELRNLNISGEVEILPYDSDIDSFGSKYLEFLTRDSSLSEEFIQYSSVHKHYYKYENKENDDFIKELF